MRKLYIFLCVVLTFSVVHGCGKPEVRLNEFTDRIKQYVQAMDDINEHRYPQAIGILRELGDCQAAQDLLEELYYLINGSYICNGHWVVGVIKTNGDVQVAYNGPNDTYSAVELWSEIQAISSGGDSIEGLTKEGKIVSTSTVTKEELLRSTNGSTSAMADVVEAVSTWNNIKAFQTHYTQSAMALTKNGSVYAAFPFYEKGMKPLEKWVNIVSIAEDRSWRAGLKSDGTVICNGNDFPEKNLASDWIDIVAISVGNSLIGLKEDGTVIAIGSNTFGEANVSEWTDIIAISTYHSYTLGLKRDGTVVAAGKENTGSMNVSDWTDIVAIDTGAYFSIGLKSDGTMVLAGDSTGCGAQTPDVSILKDIYVPQIIKK